MEQTIFTKIASILAGISIGIGSLFGLHQAPVVDNNLGASFQTPEVRALFETSLATRITSTDTSMTLTSATDFDGNSLASSTYGFIVDEGTASEEMMLADCTGTTCTNITRGLSARTGTTTIANLRKEHRRGASVKITDGPSLVFLINVIKGRQNIENPLLYNSSISIASSTNQIPTANWIYNNYVNTSETQTVNGAKTLTATTTISKGILGSATYDCVTTSASTQYCQKGYIDGVAVAGASNANTTTKGIVEEATVAEVNSNSDTGGTGAKLFMTPLDFSNSNFASTTDPFTATTSASASPYRLTTNITLTAGQKVLLLGYGIFYCNNNEYEMYIKRPSIATTTLQQVQCKASGAGNNMPINFTVLYTALANETAEVYLGDNSGNYDGVSGYSGNGITYLKFNN